MAKKSRTPEPPRRVQAPKTRSAPPDPGRRRTLVLGMAGALALVAIAAAIGIFVVGGGDSAEAALEEAGCEVSTYASQGRDHVEEVPEDFEYNSSPPTTGPHDPTPAPWDVYREPIDEMHLVHALEHGSVAVQYGEGVPQETVDRLVGWYRDNPNGLILAPYPELGDQIALSAWVAEEAGGEGQGVQAKCSTFDGGAFDSFVDEYGFQGPERFDPEQMIPGSA